MLGCKLLFPSMPCVVCPKSHSKLISFKGHTQIKIIVHNGFFSYAEFFFDPLTIYALFSSRGVTK